MKKKSQKKDVKEYLVEPVEKGKLIQIVKNLIIPSRKVEF